MSSGRRVTLLRTSEGGRVPAIHCPGCGCLHAFDPERWQWNGDLEAPTFSPSMLVRAWEGAPRCHSFVTAGRIRFLADSTHELAGQERELPGA